MNVDQLDIDNLIAKGLSFDNDKQRSDDFTIIYRYEGFLWDVNWLKHNRVFAWHVNTSEDLLSKMDRISNMTVDGITQQMEEGNMLKTNESNFYPYRHNESNIFVFLPLY